MAGAALLFDLDGTMLNTDPIHMAVFADIMAPRGLDITEDFYMAHVHGRLNVDFFAEFLPGEPDPQGLSEAKEAEFRRRLPRPYPSMSGVSALIDRSEAEGWSRAIVTNAMRLNAEAMLEAIGERHRFDTLVIGEECARAKPHPDPYLAAMQALGVAPDRAIAFEDSPSGLRAAAASGAFTVGIRSSLDDAALKAAGAALTIQDFTDPALIPVLDRLTGETP
ncbi:HAD family hydrolase [Mesobacterium pallidum]|uniref:HAD family hydrolase n=1 Tax=Mesobacterium pallidum TaxID=2872037 RepID=UPI001EE339DB|nr:HAD family phosphatase [Mesobacterium pallidum]